MSAESPRPSSCPTCGSTDRAVLRGLCAEGPMIWAWNNMNGPDPWHSGEESPRGDLQAVPDLPDRAPHERLLDAIFGEGEFVRQPPAHVEGAIAVASLPRIAAHLEQLHRDVMVLVELANHEDDCATWQEDDHTGPIECDCRYGPIAVRYPYTEDGVIRVAFVPRPPEV